MNKLLAIVHATTHPRFGERVALHSHTAVPPFAIGFITGWFAPTNCFTAHVLGNGGGALQTMLPAANEGETWCSLEKGEAEITPEIAAAMVGG